METSISEYLHTETSEPKHRLIRNSSALYLLLILCAFGCIALSSWLSARFGTSRLVFQILLYLLIIGAGYLIYRRYLLSYRYTVTTKELIVDQIVGGKQKNIVTVPLDSIIRVGGPEQIEIDKVENAYLGKKADALMVVYGQDQKTCALFLSASETLRTVLSEQTNGK